MGVHKAYADRAKRQREVDMEFLYQSIGGRISLGRLKQVPSYQEFVHDLTETLIALKLIPYMWF